MYLIYIWYELHIWNMYINGYFENPTTKLLDLWIQAAPVAPKRRRKEVGVVAPEKLPKPNRKVTHLLGAMLNFGCVTYITPQKWMVGRLDYSFPFGKVTCHFFHGLCMAMLHFGGFIHHNSSSQSGVSNYITMSYIIWLWDGLAVVRFGQVSPNIIRGAVFARVMWMECALADPVLVKSMKTLPFWGKISRTNQQDINFLVFLGQWMLIIT